MALTKPSENMAAHPTAVSEVIVYTGNGHGSTNNKIRRFSSTLRNTGTAITYADSATLGATFTINELGFYAISFTDGASGGSQQMGISLNSSQLTTSIGVLTATDVLAFTNNPAANLYGTTSILLKLVPGDVVRAHTDGSMNLSSFAPRFSIVKVADL
jgi:hypothetical protein